ncbi:MAG: SMP-30/gluconolactonase/LRE family protein [Bacteroidia bacterium]|nr:SMP-30/gluconolactonase/LRE family protein [Bacteroidia bacterium]
MRLCFLFFWISLGLSKGFSQENISLIPNFLNPGNKFAHLKLQKIYGTPGAEDIAVSKEGIAFISSDDRRAKRNKKEINGAIYTLNLESQDINLVNQTANFRFPFHPHGISLWQKNNETYLQVINHRTEKETTIEIFSWNQAKLNHIKTIKHPLLYSPNDIQATDAETFLVTNDPLTRSSFGFLLQALLRLKRDNITWFDGNEAKIVAKKISFPNGIAIKPNSDSVYVASIFSRKIYCYRWDSVQKKLIYKSKIRIGSSPDNLDFDAEGNLWTTCHPSLLQFTKHSYDETRICPTVVYKISNLHQKKPILEKVFYNNGKDISGASVAVLYKDQLLIGTVFEKFFGKILFQTN